MDAIALADKRGGILTVVHVEQTFRMYGLDFAIDRNLQTPLAERCGAHEVTSGTRVASGATPKEAEKHARKVLRKHGKAATLAADEHCRTSHPLNVAN